MNQKKTTLIFVCASLLGCAAPPQDPGIVRQFQLRKAAALCRQGRWSEANAIYRPLIAGDHDDSAARAEAMYYGGLCYEKTKDYTNALRVWRSLHHEFPNTKWVKFGGPLRGRSDLIEKARKQARERAEPDGRKGTDP